MAQSCLIYQLTDSRKRSDGRTVCHGLLNNEDTHAIIFINSVKTAPKFAANQFIRLVNYGFRPAKEASPAQVFVSDLTTVFPRTKTTFPITHESKERVLRPKVQTISETKKSPMKRKLSLDASVIDVGNLIEGKTKAGNAYKLRVVTLSNDSNTIECKMWGESSGSDIVPNKRYRFNCVEVNKNSRSHSIEVHSTDITSVEEVQPTDDPTDETLNKDITIMEIDEQEDIYNILTSEGILLKMPKELYNQHFEGDQLEEQLPHTLTCCIRMTDNIIMSISEEEN